MIDFLLSIWDILKTAFLSLIDIIISIPTYINVFSNTVYVVNLFNNSVVANLLIVIISIGVVIKIKRLML